MTREARLAIVFVVVFVLGAATGAVGVRATASRAPVHYTLRSEKHDLAHDLFVLQFDSRPNDLLNCAVLRLWVGGSLADVHVTSACYWTPLLSISFSATTPDAALRQEERP